MGTSNQLRDHSGVVRKRKHHDPTPKTIPEPVDDPRFVAARRDPRFSRLPKRAKKVVVDSRFKSQLKHNPAFRQSDTPVDRFGRPRDLHSKKSAVDDILSDDDSDSESLDHSTDNESPAALPSNQFNRDEEESEEEDTEYQQFLAEQQEEPAEHIPRGNPTRRLAVVALDWSVTRAVDILACMKCFCPPGKLIKSVEVHPSKFGLERLTAEAKFGPQILAKEDMKVVEEAKLHLPTVASKISQQQVANLTEGMDGQSDDEDDNESEHSEDEELEDKQRKEQAALRKYEEERLKYYYGVVVFDNAKTADAIYEQCDGVEYAQSGRPFDLRFIPDSMIIDTKPRDRAEHVPEGYEPPTIAPSSLNNSTVKLSWDADDPERVILKKRVVGKQKMDEENLKAYLDSSSDDEIQATPQNLEEKRNLLLNATEGDAEEDPDMGMEISFEPGMLEKAEEILNRKQEKEERKGETEWEARLRRIQERKADKRKKRKERLLVGDSADMTIPADTPENAADSAGFSDPFFSDEKQDIKVRKEQPRRRRKDVAENVNGKTLPENDAEDEARKRAELELLVMKDGKKNGSSAREEPKKDESDDGDGGKAAQNKSRSRGRRRSRKDKKTDSGPAPSAMNTSDARFQGLFDSHLFAMDPTHPKFKDNETTQKILKEKAHRSKRDALVSDLSKEAHHDRVNHKTGKIGQKQSTTANAELRQLAARVKARAKHNSRSR